MLVKQLTNLFELMEHFARVKRPLSVREIVEALGWPRSSAFNIVSTLVEHGYLYQPLARGGYYPTSRWSDLAREFSDAQPLPATVHELLEALREETGETLILAGPEGTSAVFLDVVESPADIRYIANVGQRLPIHVTAAGRAILAQYPAGERAAILRRIKYQAYERADFPTASAVEAAIATGQATGWHINLAGYAAGVAGIAVPLPFRGRRNAVVLGGPLARIEPRAAELGRLLRDRVARFLVEQERRDQANG